VNRGDVYLADLSPTQGHEQQGTRPVAILQNDTLNHATGTVVIVPFTGNTSRANLPSCHLVHAPEGGLTKDSVALCNQVRAITVQRLRGRLGTLQPATMEAIGQKLKWTLDL